MREFLTSGNIEFNHQKKIREEIQRRWDEVGLSDDLDEYFKKFIKTLYENDAKHISNENIQIHAW